MITDWGEEKRNELLFRVPTDKTNNSVIWVSKLPTCVRDQFQNLQRYLPQNIKQQITYQKPQNLHSKLFQPRKLEKEEPGCYTCDHCKLCGNHGKGQNMVRVTKKLKINNKTYKITDRLTCESSGVYAYICTECGAIYVGQTTQSNSKRATGHRNHWTSWTSNSVSQNNQNNRDDTALLDHYRNFHPVTLDSRKNDDLKGFDKSFEIVYLDNGGSNLSQREDFWKMTLKSSINRCDIITPSITI